ncbi:MAG TPA: type II toxin-antitoxin system RelE/ParE family toxin [Acetobacteraceae bacterium]|jgi:plasmid stabilization system protein ParE|nr:type II toxin-antitoxin system RelE/ParE family toxin [Acetobacteraceae bacterium]
MLPPGFLGDLPGNLSPRAARDLIGILRYSAREWGIATARRSRDRLLDRIGDIEAGRVVGHRRNDVTPKQPTLFLVEHPWVIAYHPTTRRRYRVLHGAMDFPALFSPSDPTDWPRDR